MLSRDYLLPPQQQTDIQIKMASKITREELLALITQVVRHAGDFRLAEAWEYDIEWDRSCPTTMEAKTSLNTVLSALWTAVSTEPIPESLPWKTMKELQEEEEEEEEDGVEDCDACGYTHHYEDKCPVGKQCEKFAKWRVDEEE